MDLDRAAEAIDAFLRALDRDPDSEPELAETGRRVAEAFGRELLSGYHEDPAAILGDRTEASSPGLVVVTGLATTTLCPHHLLPATGVAHVAYLPGEHVVGLGAIDRLVQCYARRLNLQETLGEQVATALVAHLGARSAGCVLELTQGCMVARGARQTGARVTTVAFAGDENAIRAPFLERLPRP